MACKIESQLSELFLGSRHEFRHLKGEVTVQELIDFLTGVRGKWDFIRIDTGDRYAHHQCVEVYESMDCDGESYIVLRPFTVGK